MASAWAFVTCNIKHLVSILSPLKLLDRIQVHFECCAIAIYLFIADL